MELEGVDAGVPALARHCTFNSGPPFAIEDPKGDQEGRRPVIYGNEEDALACDGGYER